MFLERVERETKTSNDVSSQNQQDMLCLYGSMRDNKFITVNKM